MKTTLNDCIVDPCGGAPIDAQCVKYTTQTLPCLGVNINDRLDDILIAIDEKLCGLEGTDSEHIIDVICDALQDTPTIDLTCLDNTLQANLIVTLGDQSLTEMLFWTGSEVKRRTLDTVVPQIQDLIGDIYDDTNTIDFTYNSLTRHVSADVKISAQIGNSITALSDGIFANGVPIQDQLVYGGEVTWTGVGYIYSIAAAGYYINSVFYESPSVIVTLSAADTTFNRVDTFIVDTLGQASVLTGTPSAVPTEPPLDTANQLRLSAAIVQANTIQPLQDQCIYQEGTEWVITNDPSFDPASATDPCFDSVSVEATDPATGEAISFREPTFTPFAPAVYGTLTLIVKSKATWAGGSITLQWKNFATPVGGSVTIMTGSYGFNDLDVSDCQTINIPINHFVLTAGDMADTLAITVQRGDTDDVFGFFIDNICLSVEQEGSSSLNLYTFRSGLNQIPNTNFVELGQNPLLHDTTISAPSNILRFIGNKAHEYPYQFITGVPPSISTGIVSFSHNDTDITNINSPGNINSDLTRLGINYTNGIVSPYHTDFFGENNVGYWMGVNVQGNDPLTLKQDDNTSKNVGILWHTQDGNYNNFGFDIFASPALGGTTIDTLEDQFVARFLTDKSIIFPGYGQGNFINPEQYILGVGADGSLVEVTAQNSVSSYLINGGGIAWVANYDYIVSSATYVILGAQHSSPETPITLDPADGTFDRIDLVVVDDTGAVVVITGDPSANPQNPSYDPGTQLPLSFIFVTAGSSSPVCNTLTLLYGENLGSGGGEADVTSSSGTMNVNSSNNPRTGTKDIEATNAAVNSTLTFTLGSPIDSTNITQLDMFIRSKATWGSASTGRRISIQFKTASGNVGVPVLLLSTGTFGFSSSTTGVYQQVVIPAANFSIPGGSMITAIVMTMANGGGSNNIGFYMDDVNIEKNCNVAPPSTAITADNGLTMSTATNVQLGSTTAPGSALLHTSYIDAGNFSLVMTGTINGNVLDVTNSNANNVTAIKGTGSGTSTTGVWGLSTGNGAGVTGSAGNGVGVNALSTANYALNASGLLGANIVANNVSTNTATEIATFSRAVSGGVGATGVGGIINIAVEDDSGSSALTNQIISKWTTATHATRISQLDVTGVDTTVTGTIASFYGSGVVGIGESVPANYAATRLHLKDNNLPAFGFPMMYLESSTSNSNQLIRFFASDAADGIIGQVTNGAGAWFISTNGNGVLGTSSGAGIGGSFSSSSGIGANITSTSGDGLNAQTQSASAYAGTFSQGGGVNNAIAPVIKIIANNFLAAAAGYGASVDFRLRTDLGEQISSQIISMWTDPTNLSQTSQTKLTGSLSGSMVDLITLNGDGSWQIRPITATAASAITPAEGMMLFVSTTDATFTSIGFWGYQGGSWTKM